MLMRMCNNSNPPTSGKMQNDTRAWKNIFLFLRKLNILLPYDPVISFLAIHSIEMKARIYSCSRMLFVMTLNWKESLSPTTGQWITNCRIWYTMDYYSVIKSNEQWSQSPILIHMKMIMLSERNKT